MKRFKNGEWVLGYARDSHGWRARENGGGTVVLKDSRGRIRAYFGHICGTGGAHLEPILKDARSLDEFEAMMTRNSGLTEHPLQ